MDEGFGTWGAYLIPKEGGQLDAAVLSTLPQSVQLEILEKMRDTQNAGWCLPGASLSGMACMHAILRSTFWGQCCGFFWLQLLTESLWGACTMAACCSCAAASAPVHPETQCRPMCAPSHPCSQPRALCLCGGPWLL